MNNASGKIGEDYAAQFLTKKGYRVVARNYRSRFGEIDLIAENKEYIVFAEVKTRDKHYTVSPLEAVTAGKQKKIIKTALFYLQSSKTALQPRFDVIGIVTAADPFSVLSVEHIENAFFGGEFH